MIIDGHVHIGSSAYFQMTADADTLVRLADELGFDRIFVTGMDALFYEMEEGNDWLGEQLARYPDRLMGYVSVPTPRLGKRVAEEIRRCHEKYGMRGVKIYSHPEATIAEPETSSLLETAVELGMPILSHTTPEECDYLMGLVPEAMLVMAHMGGHPYAHGDWHRAVGVARKHPKLILDTATSQIDNGMIEYAVSQIGAERIAFGTDTPLLDPWTQLAKIQGAGIDAEAKRLILGGNYVRILGLSE